MAVKYTVTGDQYRSIDRKMRDIKRQLDNKGGSPMDPGAVDVALQLILEGDIPAPALKRDMAKEAGWTLESDIGFNPAIARVADLELVQFLNYDEQYVEGKELEKRAKKLNANLGQKHAEWLLEHQDDIPEEWQGTYLVFPGTVWRHSNGRRRVPYLRWLGERWSLDFCWLDHGFDSDGRLVRPRV